MFEGLEKTGNSAIILRILRFITLFIMVIGTLMILFGTYDHDYTRVSIGLICAPIGILATMAIDRKLKPKMH